MSNSQKIRIDPSQIAKEELDAFSRVLHAPTHPALVSEQGLRTDIPEPVFNTLLEIVQMMQEGHTIALLPEDETFTTQAAANYLGVSRQFLVNLLEQGKLPFHHVGTHRRISYRDLTAYDSQRKQQRRSTLSNLTKRLVDEGVYGAETGGDDAG